MMQTSDRPTRRSFLDFVLGGGFAALAVAVLYPVYRYLKPPPSGGPGARSVVIDPNNPHQVNPVTRIFAFGRKPGILVRGYDGKWKAFSAICTHLGCTVRYKASTRQIWCPCHNGLYDLNGRNIPGTPPPRPLTPFVVQVRPGGKLLVTRG